MAAGGMVLMTTMMTMEVIVMMIVIAVVSAEGIAKVRSGESGFDYGDSLPGLWPTE